ncbi:MAG: hypothetical protein CV087_07460 [Candidatus Brocadia sp. WS118]|nr:MAG: hypothetical protein CV087_07460 [Candidatus Brocadia sp. WS118]
MRVKGIGSNQTEITKSNGDSILVSYSTPVAANVGGKFYRTEKKWSKTTSKHINAWLYGAKAEEKPQSFFDNLL